MPQIIHYAMLDMIFPSFIMLCEQISHCQSCAYVWNCILEHLELKFKSAYV